MEKTVLQRIPETNKFRLKGLTKKQIEILRKNKGNIFKALFLMGGSSLVTQVVGDYNALNPDIEPIPIPEMPETPEIPDAVVPIEIEEVPEIPEIVNVIDVENTIETFEELEFDDDIIEEVMDDFNMPESQEIDAELEEYLDSDEIIADLNAEEYDEVIISDDYIDEEMEYEIDEEGFVVEDDEIGDDEIGDDEIGDDEIGDDEIGDDEIGDDEIGDDEIGDDEIGDDEIEDEVENEDEVEVDDSDEWEDEEEDDDDDFDFDEMVDNI